MKTLSHLVLALLLACAALLPAQLNAKEPVNFVVQLTRGSDNYGQRRVFLQLDRILRDLGSENVRFTVVAYEEGINALLANNKETNQLLLKLANEGVTFEACRISMDAWGYKETDFPLEVQFVPAGAPEVIRLQLQGYKYWRP
jgi:intracellular sulfur oxidation DsrE/DsrF family protein